MRAKALQHQLVEDRDGIRHTIVFEITSWKLEQFREHVDMEIMGTHQMDTLVHVLPAQLTVNARVVKHSVSLAPKRRRR